MESTYRGTTSTPMMTREPLGPVLSFFDRIPTSTYWMAMGAAVVGSVFLFASGKKLESLFVGLWAPTILGLGAFHKFVRRMEGQSYTGQSYMVR